VASRILRRRDNIGQWKLEVLGPVGMAWCSTRTIYAMDTTGKQLGSQPQEIEVAVAVRHGNMTDQDTRHRDTRTTTETVGGARGKKDHMNMIGRGVRVLDPLVNCMIPRRFGIRNIFRGTPLEQLLDRRKLDVLYSHEL
jgi:hypothetical protein